MKRKVHNDNSNTSNTYTNTTTSYHLKVGLSSP